MNSTSNSGESKLPLIPALVGPTAAGKTDVALELADRLNLEIVSCDSRQIYKYMDIGTGKPTPEELRGHPYHLIDFVEPTELFSAARYRARAEEVIDDIIAAGRLPLIVGGTGLYLKALSSGLFLTPDADWTYRKSLDSLSNSELHNLLAKIDPKSAESIPAGNRVRAIRALEISRATGRTKTELTKEGQYPPQKYRLVVFGLTPYREKLYQLINLRVDKMIERGLANEVQKLVTAGYGRSPVLAATVGYKQVLQHLAGEFGLETCTDLMKQKTRNYAKRQITWFRHIPEVQWLDLDEQDAVSFLFQKLKEF